MKDQKRIYFGTDGIRGTFGTPPMTQDFVYRVGKATTEYFKRSTPEPQFIIGRDTRESGYVLEQALVNGINDGGGTTQCVGIIPTAAVAILTTHYKATAGLMISASHNPYHDNGVKIFNEEGFKLPDSAELQIEALIEQTPSPEISLSSKLDLSTSKTDSALYQNRLLETLPKGFSLKGFTIVTDCANGASFQTTPKILSDLGARVIPLHTEPDGKNINKNCGSQHPQDACQKIRELAQDSQNKALIGICHDGDADRLILIDDQGNPLDGDELLAILAVGLLKQNQLSKNTLVATVMSNLALEECLTAYGGTVVRTVVGDRYVLEAMQTGGFSLGGEQSGHMIFRDHLPTGDGLLSALQALHSIQQSKEPLSQQRAILKKFPQKLFNLPVKEKLPIEEMPQVEEAISKAEASLANQGRILFRYSGTENKARLLVEAKEASSIEPLAQSILEPLKAKIGV